MILALFLWIKKFRFKANVKIKIAYLKNTLEQQPAPIALDTYSLPQQPRSKTRIKIRIKLKQRGKNQEPKFRKIKKCLWSSKDVWSSPNLSISP